MPIFGVGADGRGGSRGIRIDLPKNTLYNEKREKVMKKKFCLLLALVLAFATACLSACDNGGRTDPSDVDFDAITSEKVDDAALDAIVNGADDVRNYRIKSRSEQKDYVVNGIMEFDGQTLKNTFDYEYVGDDEREKDYKIYKYQYKEGDKYFESSSRGGGKWETKEITSDRFNGIVNTSYKEMLDGFLFYRDYASDGDNSGMQWSDESSGYEYILSDEGEGGMRIVFKFSEGRLCAVRISDALTGEVVEEYVFYDFGKVKKIELPAFS